MESQHGHIIYTPVGATSDRRVYMCEECLKSGVTNPEIYIFAGTDLLTGLREHSATHGMTDQFSVPAETLKFMLTFKQVTVTRDDRGCHYFECGWCSLVMSQNELTAHARRGHRTDDFWIDKAVAPDSKPLQTEVTLTTSDNPVSEEWPSWNFDWPVNLGNGIADHLNNMLPDGFEGEVVMKPAPYGTAYMLKDKNGFSVPWKGGELVLGTDDGPMKPA